jgi:aldehyde dehydrogenase (NAD+)
MLDAMPSNDAQTATLSAIESIFHRQQAHQYAVAQSTARERIAKLRRLHQAMLTYRVAIQEAMWADFRKGPAEVDISETVCVNSEIRHAIRNLRYWMQNRSVPVRLPLLTSSAEIRYEPKGVCLLIGAWNFPFNINLIPLTAAVAAGNCVIIKPSEHAPHSAALIKKIVEACFPPEEVAVIEGGVETSTRLLALPFNHIFYTGSTAVGKIVMEAAAKHLASVTLELGGKSPVIIDESADLDRAASRVAWLKCMNAGQTCIAPDYVLVQDSIHNAFLEKIKYYLRKFYGEQPEYRSQNPDLAHMVHERRFLQAKFLFDDAVTRGAQVAFGGYMDAATNYIDPTILTEVPSESAIWEEEIFAAILPVQRFRTLEQAINLVRARPKPLALYIFSNRQSNIDHIIRESRGGGVCINECALQFFNPDLPFGGHNHSGIGHYHGEHGFREFSNPRGITRQNRFLATTSFFLPPYSGGLKKFLLDQVVRWM